MRDIKKTAMAIMICGILSLCGGCGRAENSSEKPSESAGQAGLAADLANPESDKFDSTSDSVDSASISVDSAPDFVDKAEGFVPGGVDSEETAVESSADSVVKSVDNVEKQEESAVSSVAVSVDETGDSVSEAVDSVDKEKDISESFYAAEIPDEIFVQMQGKSYKDYCTVPREDLRYVHVLHKNIEGETLEGEMICHEIIAEDLVQIFRELYDKGYAIERMRLVDEYDADDETSMTDNNSSCFNFRTISHTSTISKHGLGIAVDINPLYNPYTKVVDGERIVEPAAGWPYLDRGADFPYKIDEEDLCYQLFIEHGFEWGGAWHSCKDYQHFELPDGRADELRARYEN